jgi:hypothetical protein
MEVSCILIHGSKAVDFRRDNRKGYPYNVFIDSSWRLRRIVFFGIWELT